MLGFLSHTNTIQIHLYSYYVLRITNTNTIRVHSSGIQIHQSINWSINQLVHTQYNHSLQIISIKFIHSHLTQNKKTDDGLDLVVQTGFVCLFIFLSRLCFKTEEQTNSMIDQWSTCFHDQKSLVGVGKGGKYLFPPTGVCGFIAHFLWFSSSRETETRKFVSRSAAFLTVEVFACFPPKKERRR